MHTCYTFIFDFKGHISLYFIHVKEGFIQFQNNVVQRLCWQIPPHLRFLTNLIRGIQKSDTCDKLWDGLQNILW